MTKYRAEVIYDGQDFWMELNGLCVAKRGRPGTPDDGKWIPLIPGITVHDTAGADEFLAREAREIEGHRGRLS